MVPGVSKQKKIPSLQKIILITCLICLLGLQLTSIIFVHENVHLEEKGGISLVGTENGDAGDNAVESPSLQIILDAIRNINRPIPDSNIHNDTQDIDPIVAMDLCNDVKCGQETCLSYHPHNDNRRKRKRRIFAGGLIADDSWHAIGTNALETFGIFHSIVFVESNRTQSYVPRPIRFYPGSKDYTLLTSGIFGPNTPVHVHQFVHEHKENPMTREHMMRDAILMKWKELGMTRDDVGMMFDVDEVPSRKALRALQICDVGTKGNNWDSSSEQNCRDPVVRLSVPFFEGSPKCIHQGKRNPFARFLNPQFVIGACIQGIGDSERHFVPPRNGKDALGNPRGGRAKGYGEQHDYSELQKRNVTYFPVYNGADLRKMSSSQMIYGGAGFHLHNFFDSVEKLRFKYSSYGHVHKHANDVPLGGINSEINLLVKCVHNRSDVGNRKQRLENGLKKLEDEFTIPIAFQLPGYVEKRHEEMKVMIEEDELEYGRADKYDGHHMYRDHMLTHPGKRQNRTKVGD